MAKTIPVITDVGRLTDVTGTAQESNTRYAKFAQRLLGDSNEVAILNFGWNGSKKLNVSAGGSQGDVITLDSKVVDITGALTIGSKPLPDIINEATDLVLQGVKGTPAQIEVDVVGVDPTQPPTPGTPRVKCTIRISDDFVNRVDSLDKKIAALFRFDETYRLGDGLTIERTDVKRLNVKIGTGLKFVDDPNANDITGNKFVAVDCDTTPTEDSPKPITSGAVYHLAQGIAPKYLIDYNTTTGNYELVDTQTT